MLLDPEFLTLSQDLDLSAFWAENAVCMAFTPDKPRAALTFSPDDHWLFEFLAVPSTLRYYQDKPYRDHLHRSANSATRSYLGITFFDEDTWQHAPRRIEHLFGSEYAYVEGSTPWLMPVTDDPDTFARVLDGVERINLSEWALPDAYRKEWETRRAAGNPLPTLGTGSRGPATVMTSVLHPETVFYWMHDHPALMQRFSELLAQKMVELNQVLRAFSGCTQPGWWITDDNCALFNRRLYRQYCVPVLRTVLDALAPAGARRYQHSDSAMAHLLDEQQALGMTAVNYGPTVDAGIIRQKLPNALIHGQLPPMLLREGSPEQIRQRVRSDFVKAGAGGGLIVTTAGSTAAGTGMGRMRFLMKVVAEECRYPLVPPG